MLKFTVQNIINLISSRDLNAAKEILDLGNWSNLSANDQALWGNFVGDEKAHCQVAITLNNSSESGESSNSNNNPSVQVQCTCNSTSQPCKHAVALMLLSANTGLFQTCVNEAVPDFVKQLLSSKIPTHASPVNTLEPTVQETIEAIKYLDNFIQEIIRLGFNEALKQKHQHHFDAITTRLDHVHLPYLTHQVNILKELFDRHVYRDNQEEKLFYLIQCIELFRLYQSFYNYALFSNINVVIPHHFIGHQDSSADNLAQYGVHDTWLFIQINRDKYDDYLTNLHFAEYHFFAYGFTTQQAVILEMTVPASSEDNFVEQGKAYTGTMFSNVNTTGIRYAFFKPDNMSLSDFESMGADNPIDFEDILAKLGDSWKSIGLKDKSEVTCTIEQILNKANQHYANNIFNLDFVGVIHDVYFACNNLSCERSWFLLDNQGQALQISNKDSLNEDIFQDLLLLSGARSFSAFVRINRYGAHLLGIVCDGHLQLKEQFESERHYTDIDNDGFAYNLSHPVINNIIEQAALGIDSDVLDYKLIDQSVQSDIKFIFDHSANKASAFLQAADILIPLYASNELQFSTGLSADELVQLQKLSSNDLFYILNNQSEDYQKVATTSSNPSVETTPLASLKAKLLLPEAIIPIVSVAKEQDPYFPNEVLDLFDECNQIIKKDYSVSFAPYFPEATYIDIVRFWLTKQLLNTGKQFSQQQCTTLFNSDSDIYSTSHTFMNIHNYVVYDDVAYVENLINLGGENLKFFLNFDNNSRCYGVYKKFKKLVSPFYQTEGSIDYAKVFEEVTGYEVLAKVRQQNPALARELFTAHQSKFFCYLRNIRDQYTACAFLSVFSINLSVDDEKFLMELTKATSCDIVLRKIYELLRSIPNSQYSSKCLALWEKYVKFDDKTDKWEITSFKSTRQFSSLGIHKDNYYARNDQELCAYMLGDLARGMSWSQLKELTGSTDSKEALRRWSKFPAIEKCGEALNQKIMEAVATEDAQLAVKDAILFKNGVVPLAVLGPKLRVYFLKKALRKYSFSAAINPLLSLQMQEGHLVVRLTKDDEILKLLLSDVRNNVDKKSFALFFDAMSPDQISLVQNHIDELSKIGSEDVHPGRLDALKALKQALCFKQKVADFMSKLKQD